jgi:hypothetical protein
VVLAANRCVDVDGGFGERCGRVEHLHAGSRKPKPTHLLGDAVGDLAFEDDPVGARRAAAGHIPAPDADELAEV